MKINENLSRRDFVRRGFTAAALTLAGTLIEVRADDTPGPVDPADPTAKALEFAPASPKSDQQCAGCALYQGKAGDSQGPCQLFQGRSVPAGGWCKGWVKKPSATDS